MWSQFAKLGRWILEGRGKLEAKSIQRGRERRESYCPLINIGSVGSQEELHRWWSGDLVFGFGSY